jgi:hypothetical protein
MRQLMHGAIPFDSTKLEQLPSLVQVLRVAVAAALKAILGWDASAPPIVAAARLSIHTAVAVEEQEPSSMRMLSFCHCWPMAKTESTEYALKPFCASSWHSWSGGNRSTALPLTAASAEQPVLAAS